MNRLILPAVSLLLALALISPTASQTSPCQPGNTRNTAYMQRNNDKRCEGITTPNASRSDFGLRSLAIGQLANTSNLSLTIPKLANQPQPKLQIQSTQRYYQLDPLALNDAGNQWRFQWPNTILRKENIPLSNLRSLAEVGDARIVLPVQLSRSPNYDLRIYTGNRTQTITLTILDPKGAKVHTQTKTNQPGTEVAFTWNGRTRQNQPVAAGRYTLRINAKIERPNAPAESRQTTRQFEHDPAWLQ